ncbi:MAG TPA: asparagine synthase (glutamine-hydrolyzing) [Acidobacteriota bacterium]|nr:asparagine synthase (glutamine-hydrolyzing) [Acidobacteriota bacterium]
MCGVAGIFDTRGEGRATPERIAAMTAALAHRGPDQKGLYLDDRVGLGHARLSIIDLQTGAQPIANETGTIWIVLNGEIYNYPELKKGLESKGHRFTTATDTEVLVHLYEERGPACVDELNGQFSFAIWDAGRRALLLARDHFGICPLYCAEHDGLLLFASEIKALLAAGLLPPAALDPRALDQAFTFWAPLPGTTVFNGIRELEPGHTLTVDARGSALRQYWDIPYRSADAYVRESPAAVADEVMALLMDATRIRLRADVPVGAYLSGGLDSSGITALIARHFNAGVRTFGVRFEEDAFDEGVYQNEMARALGVEHRELRAGNALIASAFPSVVRHCEAPVLRTAPVPMFLLSRFVHEQGIKVVCTGEGADEVFGGYDIFREALVRRFVLRHPESALRPRLFERLYPQIFRTARERSALREFMSRGPTDPREPFFSHAVRWANTARIKQFFSKDLRAALAGYSATADLAGRLPAGFADRDTLAKAMYLEDKLFLSGYLLTSQGDRMAMANAVEIRPPYLDARIIDLMARVPPQWKIRGLDEKHILKRAFKGVLPASITARTKHPYRAPIQNAFAGRLDAAEYGEALSERGLREAGIFDPDKVGRLVRKVEAGESRSETEGMALAGVLSTQLLASGIGRGRPAPEAARWHWDIRVDKRAVRTP